jgi:hypothetical protein
VAGTNGKGSVCALVERVLREAGIRTGLFTSPHLVDFRERIRVDGQWADEGRLARRLALVSRLPEGKDRTFFEVCTALAFDDVAAREVEWAGVEVGLGGLPGLVEQRSLSRYGISSVTAVFEDGVDPYRARQMVQERLTGLTFPPGVFAPELGPVTGGLGEIFHFTLDSPRRSPAHMHRRKSLYASGLPARNSFRAFITKSS